MLKIFVKTNESVMNVDVNRRYAKIFLFAVLCTVAFSASCVYAMCDDAAVLREETIGRDVRCIDVCANVGEKFSVSLVSNATTGYVWKIYGTIPDGIEYLGDEFIPPKGNLCGAAGVQVFDFRALSAGGFAIVLSYVRPWEKNDPAAFAVCRINVE
ncbi:MAG: protease inhibitor I42 family protein [Synergistes sp.]|nr:protease inhibitor I42 family protein [Synergistes sp.]